MALINFQKEAMNIHTLVNVQEKRDLIVKVQVIYVDFLELAAAINVTFVFSRVHSHLNINNMPTVFIFIDRLRVHFFDFIY